MPVLSIIVPVHNAEKHLTACIESILAQTFRNFELIIINDGSTDGSKNICNEYTKTDERVLVIHQNNLGVSAARNAGLDAAAGTYIGFVDADDTVDSDMYGTLLDKAINQNAGIAICGIRRISASKVSLVGGTNQTRVLTKNEGLDEFFNEKIQGSVYDKIFSSTLVKQIRFQGRHYEDLLFTFLALSKAEKTVFMDIAKYNYFSHENSVSRSKFSKNHIDTVQFSKKIVETARQETPDHLEQAKALDFVMNISLLNLILLNDKKNYEVEFSSIIENLDSYANSLRLINPLKAKHKIAYHAFKINEKLYTIMLKIHGKIIGNAAAKLS